MISTVEYLHADREVQYREELKAVDAALGEFHVAAYKDHGVNVLMQAYEHALERIEELEREGNDDTRRAS